MPKAKRKREVQVVVCPAAFPDFATVGGSTSRRRAQQRGDAGRGGSKFATGSNSEEKRAGPELDVQETIREVHKFGAEGFTGAQKKSHAAAEYERLTGRPMKRHKIPTNIVVGMREKARKREEREQRELRESGVVHHGTMAAGAKKKKRAKREEEEPKKGVQGVFGSNKARNKGDRRRMDPQAFGPAPDVGFMQKGMLRVKKPGR